MQPPPLPSLVIPQNSKRLLMEPDVIEIPPPAFRANKQPKLKQVICGEVIDVDNDVDAPDVMILDEKVDTKNKGKAIEDNSNFYNQTKDAIANFLFNPSESSAPGSHKPSITDGVSSDLLNKNEYIDITSDDFMDFDEYAYLQAHFDNVDIPPGVEAPILFLLDSVHKAKKTVSRSDSSDMKNLKNLNALDSWAFKNAEGSKKLASMNSSGFQIAVDSSGNASGADLSSPWSYLHTSQSKKKPIASQHGASIANNTALFRKHMPVTSTSSTNHNFASQLHKAPISFDKDPLYAEEYTASLVNNKGGTNYPFWPSLLTKMDTVVCPSMSYFKSKLKASHAIPNYTSYSDSYDPFHVVHNPSEGVARTPKNVNIDDSLRKFQLFKQFDTVEDFSDHHYASNGSSVKQPSKNWAKRIQEEWKILENDLPGTIFVRVYESRMDLLRAVIIGAEGTPYHDGLFFFDVFFPSGYPDIPPNVHYHSGGLRLNPNLYCCGKVCLSLLGTWHGNKNEKWQPGVSTVLQVLVSIQALILNQKPFFNEPGYESMSGSANGEKQSQQYNERTFVLSLKTMTYAMRRPPKHFEDFVVGHFHKYAHDILVACKAYMDGAQVGCLVKGGVQDVDEGDKSCSTSFKDSLPACVDLLLKEFSLIGIDCEKFQILTKGGNNNRVTCQRPQYE